MVTRYGKQKFQIHEIDISLYSRFLPRKIQVIIESVASKLIQKKKLKKIQQDLEFVIYTAYKIRKSLSLLQHTKYYVFVEDLPSNSEIK